MRRSKPEPVLIPSGAFELGRSITRNYDTLFIEIRNVPLLLLQDHWFTIIQAFCKRLIKQYSAF